MRWQCMRTLPTRSSEYSSAIITGVTAAILRWFFEKAKLTTMDQSKLRAWWSHRQGLDGSLEGKSAAEVLARVGWARSVGGVGPYLTLFSRGGLSRENVDADVA